MPPSKKPVPPPKKLIIMVSSTVYGIEELLERVYTLLTAFGYEVWMSHKGTVPVFSSRSAFENCIRAVENCDLFLSLITTQYGSGQDPDNADSLSITHQELARAIELNKPRWVLAHDRVVFARSLFRQLGLKDAQARARLQSKDPAVSQGLSFKKSAIFGDLRVIDMYEEAMLSNKPFRDRQGNWVQSYDTDEDALLFALAQFSRYQEVEAFISENLSPEGLTQEAGHEA